MYLAVFVCVICVIMVHTEDLLMYCGMADICLGLVTGSL